MKDRYIYRGKCKDGGGWVNGSLDVYCDGFMSIGVQNKNFKGESYLVQAPVIPETVGQCTGRKDKNGKLIFEGDQYEDEFGNIKTIYWCDEAYCFCFEISSFVFDQEGSCIEDGQIEIIGNIHEAKK